MLNTKQLGALYNPLFFHIVFVCIHYPMYQPSRAQRRQRRWQWPIAVRVAPLHPGPHNGGGDPLRFERPFNPQSPRRRWPIADRAAPYIVYVDEGTGKCQKCELPISVQKTAEMLNQGTGPSTLCTITGGAQDGIQQKSAKGETETKMDRIDSERAFDCTACAARTPSWVNHTI